MKRIYLLTLLGLVLALPACGIPGSNNDVTPTAQPIPTLDPREVYTAFTDPSQISEYLTAILQEWGLPNPQVEVVDNQVFVTYTQPPGLVPSEYRDIYFLVFSAAERAAPLSSTITLNIYIEDILLFKLQANTSDTAALRRGELTTNDFLDRLLLVVPEE